MSEIFDRPRVDAMLAGILEVPLTVISATSGYGKTTAVQAFLQSGSFSHAWITLTSKDEGALWEKLSRALRPYQEALADQLLTMNIAQSKTQAARLFSMLRDTPHRPFVMVLDDCQHLTENLSFFQFIEMLTYEQLPRLHVVLIGREQPPLPLETLCSKRLCLRIGTPDLAFTPEETEGLFHPYRLTQARAMELTQRTEGWGAALTLLKCDGGGARFVPQIDGLIEEILLRPLAPKNREQLCRLSAFDDFYAEMAAAALQDPGIVTLLSDMKRRNVFLTTDEKGRYCFHTLLLTHLRTQTPQDEEQKETLYRAGLWCIEHRRNIVSVLSLFERAGRMEELFERIEKSQTLWLNYLDRRLLYQIAQRYPIAKCEEYPFVFLQLCFCLLLWGDETFQPISMQIYRHLKTDLENRPACEQRDRLLGELLIIRRLTGFDDPKEWNPLLSKAAELFNGRPSFLINQNSPFTFGLPLLTDSEYLRSNTLEETVLRCQTNLFERVADGFGHGSEKLVKAEAALLRMETDDARRFAKQASVLSREKQQSYIGISACYIQLRCDLLEGRTDSVRGWLDEINELCADALRRENYQFNQAVFSQLIGLIEGYTALSLGKSDLMPQAYCHTLTRATMLDGMGVPALLCGRYQLMTHQYAQAEAFLELLESSANHPTSQNARLEALAALSIVRVRLGGMTAQALIPLQTALNEAQGDGVLLPFVVLADELTGLLSALCAVHPYASAVYERCAQQLRSKRDEQPPQLTQREREVLALVENGKITREIAASLHISEITVKKHLSSIYEKLGARNRVEAVHVGRMRGMLPMEKYPFV